MGLNWAAALDNFSKGMGQIAQVKYSEFMRKDEAKRREAEREIDFKRQQNLARFNVDAQKEIQQMGFTHAEKIENARIGRETLRDKQQSDFQMKSLSNQELQMRSSAASAAAQARSEGARLKILEDQAGYAKADRELQQQLSVWRVPMEAAQAEMAAVMEQRKEKIKNAMDGVVPDTSYEDGLIMEAKRKIDAAVDGQVGFMVDSDHIKMAPDVKERYLSVLSTAKEDGTFPSKIEAMQRANNPVLQADPAAAGQDEFLPTGAANPAPAATHGADGAIHSPTPVAPAQGPMPPQEPAAPGSLAERYAQQSFGMAPKIDDGAGLDIALRQLDPRTIARLKGVGHRAILSPEEEAQIRSLGYSSDDFRRRLQRGGYSP